MSARDHFIRHTSTLAEFESALTEIPQLDHSIYSLEVHKDEVKAIWGRVQTAYEACFTEAEAAEGGPNPADTADTKDRYRSTYETYVRVLAKVGQLSDTLFDPTTSSPIHNRARATPGGSRDGLPNPEVGVRLPPCDMAIFEGDYASWPSFRDLFSALYINNPRLSAVEKLFHLNQKTKGEAYDIVSKAPLTNEGFNLAWGNLKARFENKRVLVNSQLRILFGLSPIRQESASEIKRLQREVNSCISALQLSSIDIRSWNSIFTYCCSTRLPETTLALWEQSIIVKTEVPEWQALDSFLSSRCQALESVSDIQHGSMLKPVPSNEHAFGSRRKNPQMNVNMASVSSHFCGLCSDKQHSIRQCSQFLGKNVSERIPIVNQLRLCYNCLSHSHSAKECSSKYSCRSCNRRHHSLLHHDNKGPVSNKNETNMSTGSTPPHTNASQSPCDNIAGSSNSSSDVTVNTYFSSQPKSVLLGTALVHILHQGVIYPARALLDPGSEGTFIAERVFFRLQLPSVATSIRISGLNSAIAAEARRLTSLTLMSPLSKQHKVEAEALVLPHLSGHLPSHDINMEALRNLPKIPLADSRFYQSTQVDLLIGSDLLPEIMLEGVIRNVCDSLMAQETIFGWVITGPLRTFTPAVRPTISAFYNELTTERDISRFWEIEDIPPKHFTTPEEQRCNDNFEKTTTKKDDGRYMVTLPFKADGPKLLGQSRSIALAQYLRHENRLKKDPAFKLQYDTVIKEYLQLGHMIAIDPPSDPDCQGYYLPHHAVIKPDSSSTKVRVVFNASCNSSSGASLNDVLHTGPALQADLTNLLSKWRFYRFVFNSDIEKMYRQIWVHPNHTPYQRIIFRTSAAEEPRDFELQTVTFGVNCAPYLAIRTLHQLARDVHSSLPLATDILLNAMYVDDVLAGAHDLSHALAARQQLITALASAGFSLRKWTANAKELLQDIPKDHLLREDFLDIEDSSTAKTLGIRWNARRDTFGFHPNPIPQTSRVTKRQLFGHIARLFDPVGWLAPCIIPAKILMQQIWNEGTGWDDAISNLAYSSWHRFVDEYTHIQDLEIPRWVDFTPDCQTEIHGFCDASKKAYAATVYIRISHGTLVSTHLLTAKTRVAPLKTISLPRLELCGAALLSDVLSTLLPQMDLHEAPIFCWTDSTIVLAWLRKMPSHWTTFVANRVSKIMTEIPHAQWFHVDSKSNPADLASRGASAQTLLNNNLWWQGPHWLPRPPTYWPQVYRSTDMETTLEAKPIKSFFLSSNQIEETLQRFSSFSRAVRVLAYAYRFFHHSHPRHRISRPTASPDITAAEVRFIKTCLIRQVQGASYKTEIDLIKRKSSLPASSKIANLNPFLDKSGVLRVSGRLVASPCMSYDERYPIILPYNSHFTRLMVQFVHQITLHGGNLLMLQLLRGQFWIPKLKSLIKAYIYRCKVCVLHKQKLRTQLMAALPPERTELTRPFTNTGLDFTGPFPIKNYTDRACLITKGYVCIFVCFATKAIHLEATSSLTTPAFLAAFSRFAARRGCPSNLYSDNGTTFVGASKAMTRDFLMSAQAAIHANLIHHAVTWHFIPPGAPHMGGLWEAGVKIFKTHFKKIAPTTKHTFEEFSTLLARVEACLNSRPLTPLADDPSELNALTPGHFLVGTPLLAPAEPETRDASISILNRWQRLRALHQQFCRRWKIEYLAELHKRTKWKTQDPNLLKDSLVAIKDDNLPPNEWRLGRVLKTYPGRDGLVRVVDLLTQRGVIQRPIHKLVVIPTSRS